MIFGKLLAGLPVELAMWTQTLKKGIDLCWLAQFGTYYFPFVGLVFFDGF